jgi:hypothetical protein
MFGQQWFESALRLLLLPPAFIQTTPFSFFTRGNNDRPWRTAEPTIFSQKNSLTHISTLKGVNRKIFGEKFVSFVCNLLRRGYLSILGLGGDMGQRKENIYSNQAQRSGDFMHQKWRIYGNYDTNTEHS